MSNVSRNCHLSTALEYTYINHTWKREDNNVAKLWNLTMIREITSHFYDNHYGFTNWDDYMDLPNGYYAKWQILFYFFKQKNACVHTQDRKDSRSIWLRSMLFIAPDILWWMYRRHKILETKNVFSVYTPII